MAGSDDCAVGSYTRHRIGEADHSGDPFAFQLVETSGHEKALTVSRYLLQQDQTAEFDAVGDRNLEHICNGPIGYLMREHSDAHENAIPKQPEPQRDGGVDFR